MGTIEEQPEAPREEERRRGCSCRSWPVLVILLLVLAGCGFLGWYFRDDWWPGSSSDSSNDESIETINPVGRQTTRIQLQLNGITKALDHTDEKEAFETACQAFFAEQFADQMEQVECQIMGRRRRRLQPRPALYTTVWVAVSGKSLEKKPIDGFAVLVQVIVAKSYGDFVDRLQSTSDFFSPLTRIQAFTAGGPTTTDNPTVSPTIAFNEAPTATPTSVATGGGAALP